MACPMFLPCLLAAAPVAPRIEFEVCRPEPAELRRGDSFVLQLAARAEGTEVKSYRVRTPYDVPAGQLPDGFIRQDGKAVLAGDDGALLDNAAYDLDPATGAVAVRISTAGWPEGANYLVAFAHNRPGDGPHILDYRNLALIVDGDRVRVEVLAGSGRAGGEPVEFELPPLDVAPGRPVEVTAKLREGLAGTLVLRLGPPYTCGENEVLPGFAYDAEAKRAWLEDGPDHRLHDNGPLDRDPVPGRMRVAVPTTGWRPGAHYLSIEAVDVDARAPYGSGQACFRDFALDVPGPDDQFEVEVSPSEPYGPGTHFSALVSFGDGTVVSDDRRSTDGGHTWSRLPTEMPRPNLLRDGTLLAMAYRALPVEGQKGVYRGELYLSRDRGRTVDGPLESAVLVPLARAALGHGPHVGPLFGRSIVELDDGSLVSAMYGWFEGDTEPDKYRTGGTMRRSYVGRSTDRGLTWEYLSTVAYRPFLGNEGYSELVIRRLPNGELLALVRTGGNGVPTWQDNPLMTSRSTDGGRTWSAVERTGVEGVWPDLLAMSDGTLVCSTGRPGAFVMFSTDHGHTWTDQTPVDAERYSGYTAICEVAPGELLMGYGAQHWYDPATGRRSDQLRLARIKVRRK